VNEVEAIKGMIDLFEGCEPFSGDNPLYSSVKFVPEYPLLTMDIPLVALSVSGGRRAGRVAWAPTCAKRNLDYN